ncbi:hypothetical protein AOC36_02295 [Erysipelothrix larvae]|uniref:ASCH domain-containing protein n=1 Tax=Erysipelothrix larvae TaxID=1514105 RepID=A0A0X8GYR0_9FIRM|nr:hypothetical protein [Erysipelothrix larvae]AMC92854.1 hypothetical protein AOC36_02295 [Erysipelothrix larvae]
MRKAEWYEGKEGIAQHLVYLNAKAKELEKLVHKDKTMIIRGAAGRKCPLGGRAKVNDVIYFVETGGDMMVTHKGIISKVIESEKMTPDESIAFIKIYEQELNLSKDQYKRWAGKRFLAVYEISLLQEIEPFKYNRENNMDDWIITDDINKIKL